MSDGLHAVGGVSGLYLQVKRPARSWILRVVISGTRRDIGLGGYPGVTLSVARQKAADLREEIRDGGDPLMRRKTELAERVAEQKRGILFAEAVEQFVPIKQLELAPGKYRDQWRDSLDKYALPELGQMLVKDIELVDVLRVLEPIWAGKTVTADKLRRKLNEILDYATVKGFRSGPNPARWEGNLSMVLPSPSAAGGEENYPALQLKDLPRFWRALSARDGMGAAGLRFQMLTATRTGAVRFMTWGEVDLDAKLWTVQPGRESSKIGRNDAPKRVPLSEAAVEILRVHPHQEGTDLVFFSPSGGPLSDATFGKVMRTIHEADLAKGGVGFVDAKTKAPAVPHGTRSSFKVWASEKMGYDWNLSEAALWHKLGNKVEQAYARTDLLELRREMMEAWAGYLMGDLNVD